MSRRQKRMLFRILLAMVLTVPAALIPEESSIRLPVFLLPYLVVGYDVLLSAFRNILHGDVFDEQFLMSIATLGAFGISDYPEAVAVMLFYQIGELFQSIAVNKSRRSIAALMDIRPDTARVLRDGEEQLLSPEEVEVGEILRIRPGERVPLDGKILSGRSSVDCSALTGESLPRDKGPGDALISGSVNLTGPLEVRVESVFAESAVSRILELVENASEKKAKVENFITRFARYYTPAVVISAVLLAFLPPLFTGDPFSVWIHRALIFLVVSCPCALVVSVPLSFFGGIGGASRKGILIKGANHLEALSLVDTMVFDKTGTLTRGEFVVDSIHPEGIGEEELLFIAAALERYSPHPLAACLRKACPEAPDEERLGEIRELTGLGLQGRLDEELYHVGNRALMEQLSISCAESDVPGSRIHVARGESYLGYIQIRDELKPHAREDLESLRRLGIRKLVMLTGDVESVARQMGESLHMDEVHASLLPEGKVQVLESLLAQGAKPAFVGDGINDAPVLSRANVGIAMGGLGSDAAIESADLVLMDDSLEKLALALKISRKTMKIVRQNILFALGVKGLILLLGAFGAANMWTAVFGDVGVMVIAILNAMRAIRI